MKIKKNRKLGKYLDLIRDQKKILNIKGDGDTGTERLGNKRTGGDHLDYSIIKIGQNTKKSPGNLRRLAVT